MARRSRREFLEAPPLVLTTGPMCAGSRLGTPATGHHDRICTNTSEKKRNDFQQNPRHCRRCHQHPADPRHRRCAGHGPAPTTVAVKATSVAAKKDRTNRPPSRGKAPHRFGTVKYNQWYAKNYMQYRWLGQEAAQEPVNLWNCESDSQHAHNGSSGAHLDPAGLCPARRWPRTAGNWRKNPETQIKWGSSASYRMAPRTAPGRRSSARAGIDLPRPRYVWAFGVLGALRDQGGSGSALHVAAVEWFNGCDEPLSDFCPTTCERPGESRRPRSLTSPVGVFTASGHQSVEPRPGSWWRPGAWSRRRSRCPCRRRPRTPGSPPPDAPDRLHAVFGKSSTSTLADAVLGQTRGRAADRPR